MLLDHMTVFSNSLHLTSVMHLKPYADVNKHVKDIFESNTELRNGLVLCSPDKSVFLLSCQPIKYSLLLWLTSIPPLKNVC